VYRWTTVPLCGVTVLLLAIVRPSIGRRPARLLDWSLLACLLAVGLQLIPFPAVLQQSLSPHALAIDHIVAFDPPTLPEAHALSVDVESTLWALALGAVYIAVFWCARATFSSGGLRTTVRGIAWLGMGLAMLVAVQRATSPTLLYWTWQPISAGASPYGPFVNRNALATWVAMALPLVIGYAMARHESRRGRSRGAIPGTTIDSTQLWLAGAAILIAGGLLGSMSRAGILGGGTALATFVLLSRQRIGTRRGIGWMLAGMVALVVLASAYANVSSLALRLQETTEQGPWGRPAIWRDTWRMAADFRWTGVGAGAFQRAMLVYQRGSREFFFNHAHNEYLQLFAEGGLLVVVPALIVLGAAIVLIARSLGADRTPIFWVRVGAVCGVVAVAVQNVWDTGLRTPANGVLFAVIAAIAVHEPRPASPHHARRTSAH
jgi:putative inorganic carbon (hco3(-)) transporter